MDLPTRTLVDRAATTTSSSVDTFVSLISNPFSSQVASDSFYAGLGTSFGGFALIALIFCVLRPYNNVVYAPRSKHADEKHAPPPIGKGYLDWVVPVIKTKEQMLIEKVGMDATLFLKFTKMCRNIFSVITIVGCGAIIPVNLLGSDSASGTTFFTKLTPINLDSQLFWVYVAAAYVFDVIICFFLWRNYRDVRRLRRAYFDSPEYQRSLHSRTLLITELPKAFRTDEGLFKITEDACRPIADLGIHAKTSIGRNVKDLPELIEEHDEAVRELEKVLAKYMKNPNKLPAMRPTCKVTKTDQSFRKGQKVDAIDYLTSRIRELEHEVKEVRESVDKRNAMSYGFATYSAIPDAHTVAYASRKKAPQKTRIILAPKPHDLIWKNLPMGSRERAWAKFYNDIWVVIISIGWLVPNGLIAIFLSDLANLGKVWPAFETSLVAHHTWWALVQGVAAPALTSLFYFFLPALFRRLSIKSGDLSKTSRERHVTHKLYTFFVINNLFLFSLFGALWAFIAQVISTSETEDAWAAIKDGDLFQKGVSALITVSTYWVTWMLQRNLGAAVDLCQLITLAVRGFSRHFLSPTPRELIELSAPQPFDYAGYYNYFLFYATVAMCFATIQPLILPICAFYFWVDSYLKKYLLLYVFITKTESGGQFWRVLFNRFVFLAFLGNCVIALLVGAKGSTWTQLYCLAPLPFLLLAFKWYCSHTFDDQCKYYTTGTKKDDMEATHAVEGKGKRHDHVGVRFGHPVLYKPLITPMVHAKSQHLLKQIYSGRMNDEVIGGGAGYSDMYMDPMSHEQPGQLAGTAPGPGPFEIVNENEMDFEHYKNRPEFRDEAGGDGELYGRPNDLVRRVSGSTMTTTMDGYPRTNGSDSRDSSLTRAGGNAHNEQGTVYAPGYQQTATFIPRDHSPASSVQSMDIGGESRHLRHDSNGDEGPLLAAAAGMGRFQAPPMQGFTGQEYSNLRMSSGVYTPGGTPPGEEENTSYDYFRRGRQPR